MTDEEVEELSADELADTKERLQRLYALRVCEARASLAHAIGQITRKGFDGYAADARNLAEALKLLSVL